MKGLAKNYGKYKNIIENLLFPVALFLYPFIGVCQGLEVVDSTYSLTNFQYFGKIDGTWMVATFLSNVWGNLLMHLPFGGTLIGMNCYTVPVQSAMALMVYFGLRKKIPAPLLFLGEMIALGLCWAPSVILYQNLTYFFMTAGILLLYRGLTQSGVETPESRSRGAVESCRRGVGAADDKRQRLYFVAAGLCLGANVAVRMPNVVHAAFILVVWYGIVLYQKHNGRYDTTDKAGGEERRVSGAEKKPALARTLAVSTGWCLAGYLAGFGLPFLAICLRYGVSAYPEMVRTLFAMTEQATDYKPASMVAGMFGDYGKGLCWLAFAGLCMAAAGLAFFVRHRLNVANKITDIIIKAGYCLLLAVLLRFYWGRGMFDFRYYKYSSIYYPAVLLLLVTIGTALFCLLKKDVAAEKKILAAAVLLEILLTPLGSNNVLYPIINNLFLVIPFLLSAAYDAASAMDSACGKGYAFMPAFLWQYPLVVLVALLLVQSIGFHAAFAFNDGIWGEPRNLRVVIPEKAAGVWTNQEQGTLLEELAGFVKEEGLTGREVICYDELPGLSYLLDMPPALSNAWPDLSTYRMVEYLRDMEAVEAKGRNGKDLPVVIVSTPVAAYLSDDGEAIAWFGVDMEACAADEKLQILGEFLIEHGYAECFGNAGYVVYCVN